MVNKQACPKRHLFILIFMERHYINPVLTVHGILDGKGNEVEF